MTSYQPAGVETALHPLRPIENRLTWDDKRSELGTRVSNAPFENVLSHSLAPKGGAPKGGAPKGGGGPKFRAFFPLPPQFSFFLPKPPGLHTTAPDPKRGHFRVPFFKTPPKFHEKTTKRGKKE